MNFHEWVTAMSVREVLDVILSYLKVILSWPGVLLIAILIFRRKIGGLISRIKSLTPTKVLFRGDVKKTADDAREAKKKVEARARRLARAQRHGSTHGLETTGKPDFDEGVRDAAPTPEVPVDDARTSKEERERAREDFITKLEEDFASRDLQVASRGGTSPDSLRRILRAWTELQTSIQAAALQLNLSTERVKDRRLSGVTVWTPVEFFNELYRAGRGSRAAVRAAYSAQNLIEQMRLGATVGDDEAIAFEEAIDDLKDTARKTVLISDGQRIVKSFLDRHRNETLPKRDND